MLVRWGENPLALDGFLRAKLPNAFDQLHRNRLRKWKTDCALADFVWSKFVLERRDQTLASGVQRVVLLPASEVQHYLPLQFVSRDLVGDHLFGSWHGLAERAS